MTPANVIDPTLLEQYAIVRTLPSWSQVRESKSRLEPLHSEGAAPYDQMVSDRDTVLSYAAILRSSLDLITYGIGLAVHLVQFSNAKLAKQRLEDGLQAISTGLDLPALAEVDRKKELERCFQLAFPKQPIKIELEHENVWRETLKHTINEIEGMGVPDMKDVIQRASDSWRDRLLRYLTEPNQPEIRPDVDYLRCRTAGHPLGTLLRGRIKDVSLREWNQAYVWGMSKKNEAADVRPWFALAAVVALGFDVPRDFGSVQTIEQDSSAVDFVSSIRTSATTTEPRKGLLILRLPDEFESKSQTAEWKISPSMPALIVTPQEFLSEGKLNLQSYFQKRLNGVLIEVGLNEKPDAAQGRAELPKVRERVGLDKIGFLLAEQSDSAKRLAANGAVAVKPADAWEASTQAFPSRSATSSPAR